MTYSEFNVNVISDPSFALAPETPMWNADLAALAEYDVTLLKPVLLFAENVTLRTFRADMLSLVDADEFRFTIMPLRRVMRFINFSIARDQQELEYIGIQESVLAGQAEAMRLQEALQREAARDGDFMSHLRRFEEKYSDSINNVARATAARLAERRNDLSTDVLDGAISAGILSIAGWGTDLPEQYSPEWIDQRGFQVWEGEEEFFRLGLAKILNSLNENAAATMFEPGSRMLLSMIPGANKPARKRKRQETPGAQIPTSSEIAASIIGRLHGLEEFAVSEILDMRQDLSPYLPAFRAAMMDVADEVKASGAQEPSLVARSIDRIWHQKVSPAMKEMELYAQRQSYPRQLLNVFTEDKGALLGAASSIGIAAGSLVAGAVAFIPAALAASIPFAKAFNGVLRSNDELEQNKLYFLYKLQKKRGDS